jgi:hypothetical protein
MDLVAEKTPEAYGRNRTEKGELKRLLCRTDRTRLLLCRNQNGFPLSR